MSEEKTWEENNFVNIDVSAAWYIEAVNKAKKQLDKFIEVFNNTPAEKYNFHNSLTCISLPRIYCKPKTH